MGYFLFLAIGAWLLFIAFGGVVPQGRVVWGRSEAGRKMRTGQQLLFGFGGVLLLAMGFLLFTLRGTRENRDCEKRIAEEVHVGVPVEAADAALKRCGFTTTLDLAKNTLYADKRVGDLIVERTQVLITLDSDKKITSVSSTKGLIGP